MGRRLFTLIALVSLALCVATVVLWVRSYRTADAVEFMYHGQRWQLVSAGGRLRADNAPELEAFVIRLVRLTQEVDRAMVRARPLTSARVRPTEDGPRYAAASRELEALLATPRPTAQGGEVSFAIPACAMALLPTCWLAARLRVRWRLKPGLCLTCGYDLRATPDRCPECGATPAAGPA